MMPEHYVEVNIRNADFELEKDEIVNRLKGTTAYRTTKYILLNNGKDWAVTKIRKKRTPKLFPKIVGVEVLSLPKNTVYREREDVDVHNKTLMARVASDHNDKAVVVKGRFEHISFILNEPVLNIQVVDIIPPQSRLVTLAEEVVQLSHLNKAVNFEHKITDITKLIPKTKTSNIIFPCRASDLTSSKKYYFLDDNPKLSDDVIEDITLIGCPLSKRIFKSLYRKEPKFTNICPLEMTTGKKLILTRCCMTEGAVLKGKTAIVPWGADIRDVSSALKKLTNLSAS